MKKQAEAWLKSAQDDLLTIEEIIGNADLTYIGAYHAQQAIEKSFKAVLEENLQSVPRIHNLIALREMVEQFVQIDKNSDSFDQINVAGRVESSLDRD
jgi:HEPN domain-containing protein